MPIAQDNSAVDLSKIFSNVAPYFLGQPGDNKTSTSTTSGTVDPATKAILDSIMQSMGGGDYSKSAAISDSQGPVANLVQQALQAQMPSITSGQKSSGLYNDTTTTMLANDLQARTAAAGSDVVQKNILNYADITAKNAAAVTNAGALTKTAATTTTTAAKPPLDLTKLLTQGALGLGSNAAIKKVKDALFSPSTPSIDGAGSTVGRIGANANASELDQLGVGLPTGTDASSVASGDAVGTGSSIDLSSAAVGGAAGAGAAELSSALNLGTADALDASLVSTGADTGALGAGAADLGAAGAGADAFAGAAAGGEIGGAAAADAAGAFAADAAGAAAVDAGASIGAEEIATAIILKVICTESVRQGLMSPELYRKEATVNLQRMSPATLRGYHYLAVPIVRWMRRNKRVANHFGLWANYYANWIVGNWNLEGFLVARILEPICWILGHTVARDSEYYKTLYSNQGAN